MFAPLCQDGSEQYICDKLCARPRAPSVCPCRRVRRRDPPTVHPAVYTARLEGGFSKGIPPTTLALPGSTLGLPHVIDFLIVRLSGSRPHAQLRSLGRGLQRPPDLLIAMWLPPGQSRRHRGRSVRLRHRQIHLQAPQLEAMRRSCLRRGHQWLLRWAAVAIIGRGCHFQRMGRRPSLARSLRLLPSCCLGKNLCRSLRRRQARTKVLPLA